MKLKQGFLLREVGGQQVVIPTGGDLNLNMMISLNETGAFLWKLMETETDESVLIAALLSEYDVNEDIARNAVNAFIQKLKEHDFLA